MALPHFYGTTDKAVVDTWYREFARLYKNTELPSDSLFRVSEFPRPVVLTDEELLDFTTRLTSEFGHRVYACHKISNRNRSTCHGCLLAFRENISSTEDECPIRSPSPWTAEQILRMDTLLKKFDIRCRYDLKGRRRLVDR